MTANVSFDNVELSELGLAVHKINGRSLAEWQSQLVQVPGRQQITDLGTVFDPGQTEITGNLSADTNDWTNYTHEEFLSRLDTLKSLLNPRKGFKKLVITGDSSARFRWARCIRVPLEEQRPVFKLPFQAITLAFQNYEPYWREELDDVEVTSVPTDIPLNETDSARPVVSLTIVDTIEATEAAVITPVTLLQIDDFLLQWKGTSTNGGTLEADDVLIIDSENMVVSKLPGGAEPAVDVVRYYSFGGAGAFPGSGFPLIQHGGSTVTDMHANISSALFHYDALFL